jgi:photosystem II stability/assembly factor-like uncharacterized protein
VRSSLPFVLVLVTVVAALATRAQAPSPAGALVFERVGDFPVDAGDVAFDDDGALWAAASRLYRLPPGGSVWEEAADPLGAWSYILPLSPPDTLFVSWNRIRRSTDGGETWIEVSEDGDRLFEVPSSGTILAGDLYGMSGGVLYSDDRGATWYPSKLGPWAGSGSEPMDFVQLPAGHPHAGRILAGFLGGIAYSDDDGRSWQESSLWQYFFYWIQSLAVGVDGRVWATEIGNLQPGMRLHVSEDGGQTWTEVHEFTEPGGTAPYVVALPGGANPSVGVLMVVEYDENVWRSDDGGQTWEVVGRVPFAVRECYPNDVLIGPDGRLYVAGGRSGTEEEWVWRMVEGPTDLVMTAAPVSAPVVIGPSGGSFQYRVTLTNTTALPLVVEGSTIVTGSYFSMYPAFGPVTATLPAGATVTKVLTQRVPASTPAGTYTYAVNAAFSGGAVVATDAFLVVKQPGAATVDSAAGSAEGWSVSGWEDTSAVVPPEALRLSVSPNPALGEAVVTLSLSEPAEATVGVYDVLGRRVALLHEGALAAGPHTFRFDGARLPAGPYVIRAAAGSSVVTRRLTLVR